MSNVVETSSSQHEASVDDNFSVPCINLRVNEQQSLESNSFDESSSLNPREDANNFQIEVDANASNDDFKVSQNRENNDINPENPANETFTRNNQENNNNAPITDPNR